MKMNGSAESHRRIRQLDCQHRIQTADLPLELGSFISLISWCFAQLPGCVCTPLLQSFWSWQEAAILRSLPRDHVVVSNDRDGTCGEYLITACVIEMVVRGDCVLDRLFRLCGDCFDQFLDGSWSEESVNNQ